MSLPPSDSALPGAVASQQALQRGRSPLRLSAVLGIVAVVVVAAWGPMMEIIAFALRPQQLSSTRYAYQQVAPFQHDAEVRMWIILIASFVVILTLATLAIVYGRRALRIVGNDVALARLPRWGAIALIVSLLSLFCGTLLLYGPVAYWLTINMSYIYTISRFVLVAFVAAMAMGALASFILNGIAARRAAIRVWLSLVVSALVMLLWFLSVAFLAQFTVAFYMHLVY